MTGIGIASVTHQTTTKARIAASRCWLPSRSNGISSMTANTIGPRNRPIVRRRRSKRSSAGDSRPFGLLVERAVGAAAADLADLGGLSSLSLAAPFLSRRRHVRLRYPGTARRYAERLHRPARR